MSSLPIITSASEWGRKPFQEDRIVTGIIGRGHLLAVFDGNKGPAAAEFCAGSLLAVFHSWILGNGGDPAAALRRTFEFFANGTQRMKSATTATVAYADIGGRRLYFGILGDSPLMVRFPDGRMFFGPEHNSRCNFAEVQRMGLPRDRFGSAILKRGQGFELTRKLGGNDKGGRVSRVPKFDVIDFPKGSVAVICTDGILAKGQITCSMAANFIFKILTLGGGARDIVRNANFRNSGDNVSAIVCRS